MRRTSTNAGNGARCDSGPASAKCREATHSGASKWLSHCNGPTMQAPSRPRSHPHTPQQTSAPPEWRSCDAEMTLRSVRMLRRSSCNLRTKLSHLSSPHLRLDFGSQHRVLHATIMANAFQDNIKAGKFQCRVPRALLTGGFPPTNIRILFFRLK